MQLVEQQLKSIFKKAVKNLDPDFTDWGKLFFQKTNDDKFGDIQTNFAMVTAKIFKQAPRATAEKLVEAILDNDIVKKVDIAGPGFINIFLKDNFLSKELKKIGKEKYDFSMLDNDGDVVIDYSSPNVAKPMHIGHLRTTIIGDALKRIFNFLGYNVIADNHLGDWGTPFGKLIVAWNNWLDKEAFEKDPVAELERSYVEFSRKAEENPQLEDQARLELKKVQNGDEENTQLWEQFVKISLDDCKRIYDRMGISFDTYYGESFYHDRMPGVVEELIAKNIAKEDDGALVVFFDEKDNLHPCIIRKKDGAYLYSTSDIATVQFKRETYNIKQILYVTDVRQETHFKQIFKISQMLGWNHHFEHIGFGIMSFNGEAFSTRKGNAIKLSVLLDEAQKRARQIIEEKNPSLPEEEKIHIAKVVGIGAVKYTDLSQNRISNVDFTWDKALSFDGNTAPYLQYSYARIRSIMRKAYAENVAIDTSAEIVFDKQVERRLAVYLLHFPDIVIKAADSYRPNLIADYLFELSQHFNTFYNSVPVMKADDKMRNSRLILSCKVSEIIKTGLHLLGIDVVERM